MSDVGQIMHEFAQAYRLDSGSDPRDFLKRVEGTDREELRLLIDGFLTNVPRQDWDPHAFKGSVAERAMAAAGPPVASWSKLLPELREKARLSRATVVSRLATALGFPDAKSRVAIYYHRMEREELPSTGVSTKVLETLGEIVGVSVERLRESGKAGEAGLGSGGEIFARVGSALASTATADASLGLEASDQVSTPQDELDRLFTEGD
jgi:hypothetical protein